MSEELFSQTSLTEDTGTVLASADTTSTSITSLQQSKGKENEKKGKGKLRERSEIWKEFTKVDKDGETRLKCNHCSKTYKLVNSSTTNMRDHFNNNHKTKQAGVMNLYISQVCIINSLLYICLFMYLSSILT